MTGFTAAFPTHLKALKVTTRARAQLRLDGQREFLMFVKFCKYLFVHLIISSISASLLDSYLNLSLIWNLVTSTEDIEILTPTCRVWRK